MSVEEDSLRIENPQSKDRNWGTARRAGFVALLSAAVLVAGYRATSDEGFRADNCSDATHAFVDRPSNLMQSLARKLRGHDTAPTTIGELVGKINDDSPVGTGLMRDETVVQNIEGNDQYIYDIPDTGVCVDIGDIPVVDNAQADKLGIILVRSSKPKDLKDFLNSDGKDVNTAQQELVVSQNAPSIINDGALPAQGVYPYTQATRDGILNYIQSLPNIQPDNIVRTSQYLDNFAPGQQATK